MFLNMWKYTPKVEKIDEDHIRVEIWDEREEVGTLYYERPKVGWIKKPVTTRQWVCVDARVDNLAIQLNEESPSPKQIIEWGMKAITEAFV